MIGVRINMPPTVPVSHLQTLHQSESPPAKPPFHRNWRLAWVVLMGGLVLTVVATFTIHSILERLGEQDFFFQGNAIRTKIKERLEDHARILQSGVALFKVSETVTREEWQIFTQTDTLKQELPGIQGIGFSLLIPRAELSRHLQKIRSEGFPGYRLKPEGDREIYSSIIYLEPFSHRNLKAFGYDMFSEPVRREAMERSRDTNTIALSGKVLLVQEADTDVQAGNLMYAPVYRKGLPVNTVEQRRAAILGWVYSPYRMNDLIHGIFDNDIETNNDKYYMQIFDGMQVLPERLLYASHPEEEMILPDRVSFSRQLPIDFNGHFWTLRLTQNKPRFFSVEYIGVWSTLVGGLIITGLLFALIRALLNTRIVAQRLAENLTVELQQDRQRLDGIIKGTNAGTWEWNIQTGETTFNDRWAEILGYNLEEISPVSIKTYMEFTHPDDLRASDETLLSHFRGDIDYYEFEARMKHKNGSLVWVFDRGRVTTWTDDGKPLLMLGTHQDITKRKQAEIELLEISDSFERLVKERTEELTVTLESLQSEIAEHLRATEQLEKNRFLLAVTERLGHVGGWEFDIDTLQLLWTEETYNIHELDLSNELTVERGFNFYTPACRPIMEKAVQEAIEHGVPFDLEMDIITAKGNSRIVHAIGERDFERRRIHGLFQDITERKLAEEKIAASLREKELLLKEIHHRVKNNLQIITSLLKLQANYIEDEQVKDHFRDCRQRIAAMANVHTLLYKSQNFAAINFEDYVRETAGQLHCAYRTTAAAIFLVIHIQDVMLPISTAISCGLLINELLTNSLKYAFPGGRKGEVTIEMQRTADGVRLFFADNGVGFPADVDFSKTVTFGLKLVHMLIKQLDGSIEQFSDNGTQYVIMFKPAAIKETGDA
jgi:PAS domain S-box-containing protein